MKSEFHSRLFGTSGIRGVANEAVTPKFAEKLGRTFAWHLGTRGSVSVGRDVRLHSLAIQNAFMNGLLTEGVDVVDCGLAPTPAMLFAVKERKASAGVIVSGSHTPPEIAGLLFFLSDTGEMDSSGEKAFENIYHSEPWLQAPPQPKGTLESTDIIEPYLKEIARRVGSIGGYRVVADPGNGATCGTLPKALEAFGCSVTTINGTPDGRFPSRSPNPHPSTLTQLARTVKETKADFGVGTDSDGDRAIFITENGLVLWGDLSGALFAENELEQRHGGTVVTTVNTSNIIKIICQQHKGRLIVTRVGPPAIAEAMRSTEYTVFATEESGKHIWPRFLLYGDAAFASGKLLQIMRDRNMGVESLHESLPRLYQQKSTLNCRDDLKAQTMKFVLDLWEADGRAVASTLEGLKVEYPDLTWFLIRTSGTEPLLRISAEGKSINEASALLARATELARKAMSKAAEAGRT